MNNFIAFTGQIIDINKDITQLRVFFLLKNIKKKIIELNCNLNLWDPRIKNYDYIKCKFDNELNKIIFIELLEKFEEKKIENKYNRILLNIKTKASAFNGINDINTIIKIIKKNNIKTFSVSDINNTDNLPKLIKLAKENNIKFIPGLEINIIDDLKNVVNFLHPKIQNNEILNKHINDIIFFVIDLETNGINPYQNEIIEIGITKIQNNRITKKNQWFIKYKNIELKKSIQNLTQISPNDLNEFGYKPELVAEQLWKLIDKKNSVLISHSEFDIGFLNIFLKKYYNKELYQPHIDSWLISQKVFLKSKSFSVLKLCNFLNITIEGDLHRALDDSFNTAKIFLKILEETKVLSLKDLNNYRKNEIFYQTYGYRVILLCKNNKSIKILNKIISLANCKYFRYYPRIPKSILQKYKDYFFIISPSIGGQAINLFEKGTLKNFIHNLKGFYDYIEIIPEDSLLKILNNKWFLLQNKNKEKYQRKDIFSNEDIKIYYNFFKINSLPLIATDSSRYSFPEDYVALNVMHSYRKIFDGIIEDCKLYIRDNKEFMNSFTILKEIFNEKEYLNILINNSHFINTNIIDEFTLINENFFLKNTKTEKETFKKKVFKMLKKKYGDNVHEIIKNRVNQELNIILNQGFIKFFIFGEELANFAIENSEIIGSRGSIGSSFIAYLLDITEVNALQPHYFCKNCFTTEFITTKIKSGFDLPEKKCNKCNIIMHFDGHNLKYEMFFGIKGNRIPDIDINVNSNFQKLCHNFFIKKYNENLDKLNNIKVLRSSTSLKVQEKNALFFISKFLEKQGIINLENSKKIVFLLKNCYITKGKHPGGIIFIPNNKEIFEYTPIIKIKDDLLTQYEWHDLDKILLKLDILGHDDPLVLSFLLKESKVNINDIKFNDQKILSLFNSYEFIKDEFLDEHLSRIFHEYKKKMLVGSIGIPEFGTSFCRRVLYQIKPNKFINLVQISGLTHGKNIWKGNSQNLIEKGHKNIDEILCSRDDLLDFLIEKKIDLNLAFEISEFIKKGKNYTNELKWLEYKKILLKNKIDKIMIQHIGKISYLFPKAHAIAYVINAFRIAYFKIYQPLLFYVSFLNRKINDIDKEMFHNKPEILLRYILTKSNYRNYLEYMKNQRKKHIVQIILEMKFRKINFLKFDFFKSNAFTFKIEDNNLRIPLCILKGLGNKNLDKIIKIRNKCLKINDYESFKKKTKLNDSIIDLLIENHIIELKKNFQRTFGFSKKK